MSLRTLLFTAFISTILISCSSTSSTVSTDTLSSGLYPAWYNSAGYAADSVSISGFGTAIASDSTTASLRAHSEAKKNLDLYIGKLAEDVRIKLSEAGVENVSNTDFILILRNAHSQALRAANSTQNLTIFTDTSYRSSAEVRISKTILIQQLEEGFVGHPRYWAAYSDNQVFTSTFR